ncbi:acetyltransferase [Metabacillus litoralis]|uniref:acetyltransferase n=1 Tax=Metabacillus litoralis TaxID=152268 RepID=UPI001CFE8BC3|nr:acetyltransferase [Metabacillus litoralis]
MEKIIIFGASGHAGVVIDIIEKQEKYDILGIFVDTPEMQGIKYMGYPILGRIDNFYGSNKGIVAIGDNFSRQLIVNKIKEMKKDFQFATAIHPGAIIGKNVNLGEGTVIVAGSVINANSIIGKHCIINTQSSVDHDVTIGDFSTVAPGSQIGGKSNIGTLSTISMGANVIQKINIGNGSLIGAGSTVIRNIPDGVLAFGTPAKVIRQREPNEKYM